MSYVLEKNKHGFSSQVVLVRSNVMRYVVGGIMLLIGLLFFVPGLLVFATGKVDLTTYFLTGFGSVFTGGALLLLFWVKIPQRLIFDNDRAALLIEETSSSGKKQQTPLPYDDIEAFQLRTKIQTSQRSRSVHYLVDVVKSDGALWTVYSSQNKAKSEDILRVLQSQVSLNRSYSGDPVAFTLPSFVITEQGDQTEVSWPLRLSFGRFLAFSLVFAGFFLVIWGSRPKMPGVLFYLVTGFLSVITLLFLYSQISALGKRQVVVVDKHDMRVFQRGGLFPAGAYSIPYAELKAILFNFSPNQEDSALYLLRNDEFDIFHRSKQGDFELMELSNILGVLLRIKRIHLQGYSVAEMLYVEQLLQRLIKQQTGQRPA